jgi:hypothetical protein
MTMTPLQSDERLHDAIRAAAQRAEESFRSVAPEGVIFISFEPGDGTKYDVMLFRQDERKLYCAVQNFACTGGNGLWGYTGWAHASYVHEKQHVRGSSAAVVADLINLVGGFES